MDLPEQLEPYRDKKIWLNYSLYRDGEKLKKPPVNPYTLRNGSSTNPNSWATFDEANANIGKMADLRISDDRTESFAVAGVGISLEAAGFTGIDLDHVIRRDGAGKITGYAEEAKHIWQYVDSYTEISVSGTGIHILAIAKNPNTDLNKNGLPKGYKVRNAIGTEYELYDNGRYFTFTGNALKGCRGIESRQEQVNKIAAFLADRKARQNTKSSSPVVSCAGGARVEVTESDAELWDKMFASAKGSAIRALYDGDLSAHGGDHSDADQAMCNHLAYWTNCDESRIDRMFRQTGLMRDKWDREGKPGVKDYRDATIAKAMERGTFTGYSAEQKKAYARRKEAEERKAMATKWENHNSIPHGWGLDDEIIIDVD